jgi:hypothetical protein
MKINYPIHVFAPLTPILSQINPVHIFARYIFVGYLTLLQVASSLLIIRSRFCMHFSTLPCCAYMYCLFCSPLIGSSSYLAKSTFIFSILFTPHWLRCRFVAASCSQTLRCVVFGAFETLQKATVSSVSSFRPRGGPRPPLDGFS